MIQFVIKCSEIRSVFGHVVRPKLKLVSLLHRPMQLLLKPVVKRGFASLMMLKRKRTYGKRRRSTMQHKQNPEQGSPDDFFLLSASCSAALYTASITVLCCPSLLLIPSVSLLFLSSRFGVSQTSEDSSRSSIENGGRERDHGSESDEDEDSEQNTSDMGRLRTAATHRSQSRVLQQPVIICPFAFIVCIVSRSRMDGEFQGLWRDCSTPSSSRVGQLSWEGSKDTANRLGQLH